MPWARPVRRLERFADDDLVALDEHDLVPVPRECQRGGESGHASSQNGDLHVWMAGTCTA